MEAMVKILLAQMGFKPEQVRGQINDAALMFKKMIDQMNRIEYKLNRVLEEEGYDMAQYSANIDAQQPLSQTLNGKGN